MADTRKILVVEDDKFLMLILKSRLEREGFTVFEAENGEDGLAKAREVLPDIVLLDIIMPKMSGFEFLEAFRVDPQLAQIPVIVASNLGQETDIEKARQLGAADYYVKATTPVEDIVAMTKRALGISDEVPVEAPPENYEPQGYAEAQPIEAEQVQGVEQPVYIEEPVEPPVHIPVDDVQYPEGGEQPQIETPQEVMSEEIPPQEPVRDPNQPV